MFYVHCAVWGVAVALYVTCPRDHFATLPTYVAPSCAIVQAAVFPEAPLKGPLRMIKSEL